MPACLEAVVSWWCVNGIASTLALLLAICLALPIVAELAQAAVPAVVVCLVGLFVVRLALRRRGLRDWDR